jgi:23S rRNA pseudouridine1911/1915/1917 synthase
MGKVTINGLIVKPSFILQGNEKIECRFELEKVDHVISPEKMDLDIIHEDDQLAIINKPAGLVVHPGNGNQRGTLLNGLLHHFHSLSCNNSDRPGIIHRLDKETSGLILIAKNDQSHENLSKQFNQRVVMKEYKALVWGELKEKGTIDENIDRHFRDRKIFTVVSTGGRNALTNYQRDEYLQPMSLVSLFPKTGRTHQLRVHLKFLGHPIFGDVSYGGGKKNAKSFHIKHNQIINRLFKAISRVALHAKKLEFHHPVTNDKMNFTAPMPVDFKNAINILKDV